MNMGLKNISLSITKAGQEMVFPPYSICQANTLGYIV